MNYNFDAEAASEYKSQSQIIRVLTESWTKLNMFCPRCGNHQLERFPNNQSVADFFCQTCQSEYELKSKNGPIGRTIADGAYETFIQRITGNNNPDFFILNYDSSNMCVNNFWVIPKHFFVPKIIEKRKPLSSNARRAGWVGCNIIINEIPMQGKISVIENQTAIEKKVILEKMKRAALLHTSNIDARGWLLDILNCVNEMPFNTFTLNEIYQHEEKLKVRHPQNNNIRPKIRQQLQILRDKGFIDFIGRGLYSKNI